MSPFILIGCKNESKIIVATSANMQFPLEEIIQEFNKDSNIRIELVVGSSGKLCTQIEQGAPYDIFIAANSKYPEYLYELGLTTDKPEIYANGKLILWTCKDLEPSMDILVSEEVEKIAIANPKHAPYGQAAIEVLKKNGIFDQVESKLVYAESVAQCNHFITTKAADIGFTAYSAICSDEMKDKGTWIQIDLQDHHPIEQAVVLIKNTDDLAAAQLFYDYIFSQSSINILKKFGYVIPGHE